jgi:hypothetical protein
MKTHATRALLSALALAGGAACTDLPTAPTLPTEEATMAPPMTLTLASVAVDPLINGSFETGDFTGWTATPLGGLGWAVGGPGEGGAAGMALTTPVDGAKVAWNSWNAAGPATFKLYQDVQLPADVVEISFKYRAQWVSDFSDSRPRRLTFDVYDTDSGALLGTLHSFETGVGVEDPFGDSGWTPVTVPFVGVAGQLVRLQVTQVVEDFFPGPGQVEVDGFAMTYEEAPAPDDPPSGDPPAGDEGDAGSDPTSKDDCRKGGWTDFGFKNQGQCVRFVETGKDSR